MKKCYPKWFCEIKANAFFARYLKAGNEKGSLSSKTTLNSCANSGYLVKQSVIMVMEKACIAIGLLFSDIASKQ